jgi:hypothetical protein
MVTVVVCAVVTLAGEGDTVTAGVCFAVTVTDPVPEAGLYTVELLVSGV